MTTIRLHPFSVAWRYIEAVARDRGMPSVLITGPFTSPAIIAARQDVAHRMQDAGLPFDGIVSCTSVAVKRPLAKEYERSLEMKAAARVETSTAFEDQTFGRVE